jgi:hypothetical protein
MSEPVRFSSVEEPIALLTWKGAGADKDVLLDLPEPYIQVVRGEE